MTGPSETTMPARADTEARMRQVTGHPPRIGPLADGLIGKRALELLDSLRAVHDVADADRVHPSFQTLFRHHDATQAYLELGVLFTTDPALAPRDKELAILRTGWLLGAPIVWGEHLGGGKTAGLTAQDIERLTLGSVAEGWSEDDRAIVRAAEELHFDAMISDETWAVLASRLDERQLIELPMIVGHYHMTAFLQNSLRFPPREGNPGLAAR